MSARGKNPQAVAKAMAESMAESLRLDHPFRVVIEEVVEYSVEVRAASREDAAAKAMAILLAAGEDVAPYKVGVTDREVGYVYRGGDGREQEA
jgi:hypothetical protein